MTRRLLLSLVIFALNVSSASATLHKVREVHFQMGTYLELTLWHAEPQVARALIRDAVQEVHRLDGILSSYDADSALSRLNRRSGTGSTAVPPEIYELLMMCRELAKKTGGAFDVTVGPLIELWRNAGERNRLPSGSEMASVLSRVGYDKLALEGPNEVTLRYSGMAIDFGGVGKGYAVDRVVSFLRRAGVTSGLINFGGSSIAAIGAPSGETYWDIAIGNAEDRLYGSIGLRDQALATSESMGRSWVINGKEYGHLVDPLSGLAVTQRRLATVVVANATLAEALTKPLILRGTSALALIGRFPSADAIVIPPIGTPSMSENFGRRSLWKEFFQ